jgi:hypothetical protein
LWAPIISHFPKIKDLANPVGSSNQSWLFLLVAVFLVGFYLTGRTQREWARIYPALLEQLTRLQPNEQKPIDPPEVDGSWFSSRGIFLLTDVSQRERWALLLSRIEVLQNDIWGFEREKNAVVARIGAFAGLQNPPDPQYAEISEKLQRANDQLIGETRSLEALNSQLLSELYGRLTSGMLISKGFLPPVKPEDDEVLIPSAQWRLLRFDKDLNNAEGGGIAYTGIAVGRTKLPQ